MTDDKVILRLKDIVTHANGDPVKQPEKIKNPFKKDPNSGQMIHKTQQEIMDEAPTLTRGELLSGILMNGIVPKDAAEAAVLNRLAKKVNNVMTKAKGEWEVEESKVDELMALLGKVQTSVGIQLTLGDAMDMLEEAKSTLLQKRLSKDHNTEPK